MDLGLKGRVALVTGSSSGIGRAIALYLVEEGAHVVVTGRDEARVNSVAKEVEAKGVNVLNVLADITVVEDLDRMVKATMDRFGRLDVLVTSWGRS
jgi:NAD(P)-dependent dehydrogenase (short-subunit alcohol dehydrogenase family)